MENKLLIFGIVLLLVLQIGFVLAQEEGEIDISEGLVLEDISVSGIGVEAEAINPSTNKVEFTGIGLRGGESSYVKIGDVEFPNIKSGFMKFGKDGEIKEANFLTDDKETSYWVNEIEFIVPANSRFIFDGKKGFILADGTEVKNVGSSARISGDDFKLWRGEKQYDVSGSLDFDEEGRAYVKTGDETIISKIKILKSNNDVNLYFDEIFDGSKHLDENYYFYNGKEMALHSIRDGEVNIKVLARNSVLNTDEYDELNIKVANGDGMILQNRKEEGLIPDILHERSDNGETLITNNGLKFKLDKDNFLVYPPEELTIEKIYSGKYQSVPFEIISDSGNTKDKLRVNAYRQFVFVSENGKESVSFNNYGLPVSNLIKDNELQTLEQFKEKYPSIEIELPELVPGAGAFGLPAFNGFKEDKEVPPYLIYFTDVFLSSNQEAVDNIKKIQYSDFFTAYAESEKGYVMLGLELVDPYSKAFKDLKIREITSSLEILEHEYGHLYQGVVTSKENEIIKNSGDKKIARFLKKEGSLKEEQKELMEIGKSYERYSDELIETNKKIKVLGKEIDALDAEIKKHYHETYNQKTLQQIYNELALGAREELFNEENVDLLLNVEEKIEKEYVDPKLNQILRKTYGKSFVDWGKEQYGGGNPEIFLNEFKGDELLYYQMTISDLLEEGKIGEKDVEELNKISLIVLDAAGFKKLKREDLSQAYKYERFTSFYGISAQNPELSLYVDQLNDIVRQSTGLPYQYGLRNYNREGGNPYSSRFSEISTTFLEQPINIIKKRMNSHPKIKEIYEKLTQLAFDSGEINSDKYKKILGEEFCKIKACLDKLCIEYKFLCCEKHPASPNC